MDFGSVVVILSGVVVGVSAALFGVGGGFLMIPIFLYWGFSPPKAVGTSFLAILIISVSALVGHNKLAHVDYRCGLLLGLGGVVGAQLGARLVEHVPVGAFKIAFACILVLLAGYLALSARADDKSRATIQASAAADVDANQRPQGLRVENDAGDASKEDAKTSGR